MIRMANAASAQAVDIGKERLRDFLENSETGRQAMAMSGVDADNIRLNRLDSQGKKQEEVEDLDDI